MKFRNLSSPSRGGFKYLFGPFPLQPPLIWSFELAFLNTGLWFISVLFSFGILQLCETSISFPPTLKYKVSAYGSNILHIQTFSHFLKRNILERNWKRTHQKFTLFTRDYLVFIIPLRMGIGFSSENNFWAPSMGW